MSKSYRDKRRAAYHQALRDNQSAPFDHVVRVTGTQTHNWRQAIKEKRRRKTRAADRREVRSGLDGFISDIWMSD